MMSMMNRMTTMMTTTMTRQEAELSNGLANNGNCCQLATTWSSSLRCFEYIFTIFFLRLCCKQLYTYAERERETAKHTQREREGSFTHVDRERGEKLEHLKNVLNYIFFVQHFLNLSLFGVGTRRQVRKC